MSTDADFIASIFGPLSQTSVIGNGSFSDADTSVSQPTKSKHYVWKCTIDSPAVEFPLRTKTLIDNGAHIVLIRPDLVVQLNLQIHSLQTPELVDVALNSPTKKTQMTLTHFVKFRLTSLDGKWTSRIVSAFIVQRHQLRPFKFPRNKTSPPPPKLHLREEIKITKAHKKETLRELVSIVANKWLPCRGPDEIITPIDKVAAV